ncbi:M56 family metallopeptidase [Candidatus Gottesmanbacteria bacterium]|nr:M56 family metallopeptidase [Candidatus Gottesmanbacteria bacterium]
MIKPNKNLLTFLSLALFLGLSVFTASQRILPLLLEHSVYYCQTFIHSLSLRIPHQIGLIIPILLAVLVSVAAMKFFIIYIQTYRLRKKLIAKSKSQKDFSDLLKKLGLANQAYLVKSDKPFAFCFGIRRPKIYVSTATVSLMNEAELEAILLHEKYHLDNKDTLTMLLASICQSLFPFFPLISDLLRNFRIEREIAADQEAIRKLGDSEVLISVLKKFLTAPSIAIATAPAIADFDTLELRIKALVKHDFYFRKFRMVNIILSIIAVVTLSTLILVPVHAVELHADNQDVMMVCLQGDACSAWCKDHNTVKPYSQIQNASYPYTPVAPRM